MILEAVDWEPHRKHLRSTDGEGHVKISMVRLKAYLKWLHFFPMFIFPIQMLFWCGKPLQQYCAIIYTYFYLNISGLPDLGGKNQYANSWQQRTRGFCFSLLLVCVCGGGLFKFLQSTWLVLYVYHGKSCR